MNPQEQIKKRDLNEEEWMQFYGHCVVENITFEKCHALNNGKCMNGFGNMLCRVDHDMKSHQDD